MRRPEDVKQRIANIGQIEEIIVAMRGLAAAHSHDAQQHLVAIRAHEATIATAIAQAMTYLPTPEPAGAAGQGDGRLLRIVIGAEQGFSGTYNERIIAAALDGTGKEPATSYLVIGQRCIGEFAMRGANPAWSAAMVSRVSDAPALASRMADALFERINSGRVHRVELVSARPGVPDYTVGTISVLPFEFGRFKAATGQHLPMLTLRPDELLAGLIEEYVFTELCEALILGFAAENDARMRAMTRARSNVERISADLKLEYNQGRQEQTTTEIIELSASAGQD